MKIICIGRNYTEHIAELANERPSQPVIFMKPDTAIHNPEQDFTSPNLPMNMHYEVELLVKISKLGKHIDEKFASNYYDEIGLGIDFTARDVQNELKAERPPLGKG